jgi:hypothetical protein
VVAPWRVSLFIHTRGWRPGLYALKVISGRGAITNVPLVIRSRRVRGTVALVAPVSTWQSYNDWGGYSLYHGPPGLRRSWAVSYDRPYNSSGKVRVLFGASQIAVRAERLGIDLAYLTNVDLDANPRALRGARAYVSLGHDEYWSRAMRRRVAGARAHGTNVAFFGANTEYWRIRLQDRATGRNRLQVGYRTDAALDPVARRHPRLTTARWRDHPFPLPENTLTGMQYECFPVDAGFRVTTAGWWGFRGTRVHNGSVFPHLFGVEADRVYPIASTPRPLQIVAHSRYSCGGVATSAQAVYGSVASGAAIFNAGTLRWSCAMSGRCAPIAIPARTRHFVKTVTDNVLRHFARPRLGRTLPAHDNLARFHLPRHNQVPASKERTTSP